MKHLIHILLILLTVGFTACQRQTTAYPSTMQQAETLMNTRPDSALTLLEAMADTLVMLPEETLLTTQTKDKQYITHTSDSLINRIVSSMRNTETYIPKKAST